MSVNVREVMPKVASAVLSHRPKLFEHALLIDFNKKMSTKKMELGTVLSNNPLGF